MLSFVSFNAFAQISYSTLYDNTTFNNAINLSLPVGSVGGSDATSSSGSAAYSIPVTIPVGTNGIVPQLSLQYSSSANNNSLGWGWALTGLSSIMRSGTDIYHDGKVNGVKFTNEDVFLLDGSRLVATTGTNGAINTIYNTEVESFNKVTSLGTSGTGPDYFTVLTKDGNTIEYGNTNDSKVLDENSSNVAIWRINKMTDVNGNYIEFKYINTDRDFRIDEINYTGNAVTGMLPYNKVKFNYEEREDKNILYDAGAKFVSKYLLNNITITGEAGVFFKKYNLKYGKGDLYSFLMEVEEVGSDNTVLNPTKFLYGEIEEDVSKVCSSVIVNKTEDFFSGDFDGDGYSDLVGFNRNIANQTNIVFYDKFTVYKRDALTPNHYQSNTTNIPNNSIFPKWGEVPDVLKNFSGDFDGDGDDDILIANVASNITTGNLEFLDNVTIYYSSNNATVFTPTVYAVPSLAGITYNKIHNNNFILQGDFDGDGGGDYILIVGGSSQAKGFFSSPTKGIFNEFIKSLSYTGFNQDIAGPILNSDKLVTADFDGDGKTDIICVDQLKTRIFSINKESGTGYNYKAKIIYDAGYPTVYHSMLLGDFNGDGKTDFLTRWNDPAAYQWEIGYSTGTSAVTKPFVFQHSPEIFQASNNYNLNPSTDDHLDLGDFNGDGKTDILIQYENSNYTHNYYDLYYSLGEKNTTYSTNNFSFKHFIQNGSYNMVRHVVGDFNGDGRHDFIDKGAYFNPIDLVYFGAKNQERLLKKVSNGMGHVTEYNYDLLTNAGSFYSKDNTVSYPLNDIQPAIYIVSSIKTPDGIGGTNETKFSYEGLKLHKQGRGLLGFRKTKIENINGTTLTDIESSINSTYYVTKDVKTKVFNTVTNVLVSVVENKDVFTNIVGFRFKLQNEETKTTNGLSGSEIKIIKKYDGFGNISESTETVDALETIYSRTDYGAFANTVPNRPTKVTIEKTRS
jgi:hypothetical protein